MKYENAEDMKNTVCKCLEKKKVDRNLCKGRREALQGNEREEARSGRNRSSRARQPRPHQVPVSRFF